MYGPGGKDLPDLIIHWNEDRAAERRFIESPEFGTIAWPTPGRNPDGRSGHHRAGGWLISVGAPFAAGVRLDEAHILDLAPTLCQLLELPTPDEMTGRGLLEAHPQAD